ncbi:MAG: trimethylamine methyltransferase [Anaerolineales bacterium]|nr:trimethylamine methyltransferase [Anaerolineales bacterium]
MSYLRTGYMSQLQPSFKVLSHDQVLELHNASLEILDRIGVRFYHDESIEIMKRGGCQIDEGNIVKIPSWLVERSIRSAPKRIMMCDQEGNRIMPLEGRNSFLGTGSDCLHVVDHRTNKRRQSNLSDVVEGMRVCDALPNIDFVMSMFYPWDVPADAAVKHQMEVMLEHTNKPIVFVTESLKGCVDSVRMAEVVAGGEAELRKNPFVACYINVTTPLRQNREALEKVLYLSGKGLPYVYVPSVRRGITSPMTMASGLAMNTAGILAGLVLSQLNQEGSPIILCAGGAVQAIDLKTLGSAYAAPERLYESALPEFYGLPRWGLGGCSDSKTMDEQAVFEAGMTMFIDILNGVHLIHDVGYLEGGLSGSLELLVICDEMIGWMKQLFKGLEISEETLAIDLIEQVGHDGQYIDSEHTVRHLREDWFPELIDRETFENWIADGAKDLREKAREKVDSILDGEPTTYLSDSEREQIKSIVREAGESG